MRKERKKNMTGIIKFLHQAQRIALTDDDDDDNEKEISLGYLISIHLKRYTHMAAAGREEGREGIFAIKNSLSLSLSVRCCSRNANIKVRDCIE
jgi:hypothetical protein